MTLLNDDEEVTLPVISIEDAEVIEGDRRRNRVTIHLTLSEPAPELVRIQLTTVEGTATPVEDYVPLTRWRRILPGNDSATFMIRIIGDRIPEPDEFFTVRIIDAEGAVIGTDTATVTIINDD